LITTKTLRRPEKTFEFLDNANEPNPLAKGQVNSQKENPKDNDNDYFPGSTATYILHRRSCILCVCHMQNTRRAINAKLFKKGCDWDSIWQQQQLQQCFPL